MSATGIGAARRSGRRILSAIVGLAALALGIFAFGPSPSQAATPLTTKATLIVTGFDASVAEANGYRVVTSSDGTATVVPSTNKPNDLSNGVPIPAGLTRAKSGGSVQPNNTGYGECGTSWLYFTSSTQYRTGFSINGSYGNAVWRTWQVSKTSTAGSAGDGFNSIMNASSWQEYRAFGLGGTNRRAQVSDGWVLTAFGFTCSTIKPWDTW
ncbi:MAG: hypothetical protein KDB18_03030 [Salinibacterium sp.]|jgi:hypothetical protein|nr:hypothetical protein [Salinibacterium sp.]